MFTEDRTRFLDIVNGFADTATLDGVDVVGIYDGPYQEGIVGLAEGYAPTFLVFAETADAADHGSDLMITSGWGTGTYIVREIKPDGTGFATLTLERQ